MQTRTRYWHSVDGINWARIDRGAAKSLLSIAAPLDRDLLFPGERKYTLSNCLGQLHIVCGRITM